MRIREDRQTEGSVLIRENHRCQTRGWDILSEVSILSIGKYKVISFEPSTTRVPVYQGPGGLLITSNCATKQIPYSC